MIASVILVSILAAPPAAPIEPEDYQLVEVGSFNQPLLVTAPTDDDRLFVVERGGRVRVVENGTTLGSSFINVSNLIRSTGGEQGLLGLAFHRDYSSNGRFFLAYTRAIDGAVTVAEFHATPTSNTADPGVVRTVLVVPHPFSNHNGGHLLFGPDGFLYIGVGDGGGSGDPLGSGQDTDSLLGKILRIDIDDGPPYGIPAGNPFAGGGGRPEIWLYGLRNPWRFWIDPSTSYLYVADVGQGRIEEVTILPPNPSGRNLGWNRFEGRRCFPSGGSCPTPPGNVFPQIEYPHPEGSSITGGVAYRGSELPELSGQHWYGDFVGGWINGFVYDGSVTQHWRWAPALGPTPLLASFGTDGHNEVYIVSLGGTVWKLVGRSSQQLTGDLNGDGRHDRIIRRGSAWLASLSGTALPAPFEIWTIFSPTAISGWTEHLVGDFNNDGRDDIAHYRQSTGNWTVSRSTGTGFTNSTWTTFSAVSGWTEHLVGDFNGDGRDDIAHYRASTGNWTVSRSTGSGFTNSTWTTFSAVSGWTEHLVGDFNNDGRDDIAHYRPSTGNWTVSRSTGTGFTNSTWTTFTSASGWTEHLVGDFNNDGRDDIAHYRPSTGNWTVSRSTGTGFTNSTWTTFSAVSGWTQHLVGDFNNDGRDDIAHYRPSTGNWTVSRSTGTGFTNSTWTTFSAVSGWTQHLVGDYNGDGRDDIAHYRQTTGNWTVSRSTGTSFTNTTWPS